MDSIDDYNIKNIDAWAGKRFMSRGKRNLVLAACAVIVAASLIIVLFVTNANSYNTIVVVAETEKTSYQCGETVNITLRTVRADADFSSNKTFGLWVARIPDEVNPDKVVGSQNGLASMIAGRNEYSGGYRCRLSVSNFSTSSNVTLTWNGTVEGPPDPFQDWSLPQNTTYMAPAGYYLIYGDQYSESLAPKVDLMYKVVEHSTFYLDGIEPRVNWTYDNSTKEVAFGVNLTSTFTDGLVNCSLGAAAWFSNGNNSDNFWDYWNESVLLLPMQNESFGFTMENASLSEQSDTILFTAIIGTDIGRFFVCCSANAYVSPVDWESYGA
jgi:hypothetical protein